MAIQCDVVLWGKPVGVLAYEGNKRIATFEFTQKFIGAGVDIAPLKMPLDQAQSNPIFSFPYLNVETYKGLPAAFSDTLPDDFGNAVIDAWLARNGRDIDTFTAIERLLYAGNRSMGAFEYQPAIKTKVKASESLHIDSLVKMAQTVLDNRSNLTASIETDKESIGEIMQVGTSAGGARAKAVVAINSDRSIIKSGQVDAPKGFEHYLLKFDGVRERNNDKETFGDPLGYGRMEYAYYLMAKDCGINISPSELLIEGERAHFLTKRFDRKGNKKIHYQSLCAMDHADFKKPGMYSYEQLFGVLRKLKLSRDEAIELYRRMVFNVVARNHDDHTKNFGFILDSPTSNWKLAPAFDIAYSYKKGSEWVNSHQLTINGKRDGFARSDLLLTGQSMIFNFKKESEIILNETIAIVSEWDHYSGKAGVFEEFSKEIKANVRLKL